MKDFTMHDEFEALKKVLNEILKELKINNEMNLPKKLDKAITATEADILNRTTELQKFPFVVRGNSDKAYLLEKRWVKNPETLQKLGFTLDDIQTIPMPDFMRIKEGQPIDLKDEPIVEKPKIVPPPSMTQIFKNKEAKGVSRKTNKK